MSSRGGKKKSTKTSRSAKAGVIFPVGRMLRYIKKGHPKYRIGVGAPVYMAAVLEYLTGECRVNWDTAGSSDSFSGAFLVSFILKRQTYRKVTRIVQRPFSSRSTSERVVAPPCGGDVHTHVCVYFWLLHI